MALSRDRDALVQRVGSKRPLVYQPLVPHILAACCFGEWLPVARDIYYAVALFLQVRAAHPDLIQKHRGPGSLLLTPRLDTQATFVMRFFGPQVEGCQNSYFWVFIFISNAKIFIIFFCSSRCTP